MLVGAAAARWGVAAAECSTADSHVLHAPGGRRLSYFEPAAEAARQPSGAIRAAEGILDKDGAIEVAARDDVEAALAGAARCQRDAAWGSRSISATPDTWRKSPR